jgi:hypothetical protein
MGFSPAGTAGHELSDHNLDSNEGRVVRESTLNQRLNCLLEALLRPKEPWFLRNERTDSPALPWVDFASGKADLIQRCNV